MLKRTIKYTTFDDEEVEEVFYFNFSKPELIDMDAKYEGGIAGLIRKISDSKNIREIIGIFKMIILDSYGEKSDDGKRFIKSDERREAFSQSAAYETLYMELCSETNAAVEFLVGVMPKEFQGEIQKAAEELTATPTS